MRPLLWLALGLVAGIGIGWLLAYDPLPRARSAQASQTMSRPPRTETRPDNEPQARHARETDARRDEQAESNPADTEDPFTIAPGAQGILEIDFRGSDVVPGDVTVSGRSIWDEIEEVAAFEANDGVERYKLWPVDYLLEWHDGLERRVRVRIIAGETKTIRLADSGGENENPVPAGKGRLRVSVFDLDGNPLGDIEAIAYGRGASEVEDAYLEIEGNGRGAWDLRPGKYRVQVGSRFQPALLEAGEETALVFRYGSEGELIISCPLSGYPVLRPVGGKRHEAPIGSRWLSEEARRLVYVRPGTWEVLYHVTGESGPRNFGTVRIDARRRTHLKAPLPRGGIRLRVECLGAPPLRQYSAFALQRVDSDEQPVSILRQLRVESKDDATLEWPGTLDIPHVPAGLWEATCRSRGYDCDTVRVTVADTMADLTLQLRKR